MSHIALGLDGEARAARAVGRMALRAQSGGGATLVGPFLALGYAPHEDWAWSNYKALVLAFADDIRRDRAARGERTGTVRLLEVGGGRDPLFTLEEARQAGLDITVNDIDADELAMAPEGYGRALFDIAGEVDRAQAGRYDLIFSKMVFEHVGDVARAWGNCHLLLAPGGVALAFHPTLFAPPFLINKLIPEWLSARVLRFFFPGRHDGEQPKFPALYDWCYGDVGKVASMFDAIGFRDRLVAPFWTHGYFRAIPVLRELDAALQNLARKRDWRSLTTYAYTVARK